MVRNTLMHVRKKYAGATHISIAYHLAGLNKAYDEDYLDDAEHSMGRKMLEMLVHEDVVNKTVFLVRYYGGQHLGIRRFEIMAELCQQALGNSARGHTVHSVLPLHCLIEPATIKRPDKPRAQRKSPKPKSQSTVCMQTPKTPAWALQDITIASDTSEWATLDVPTTRFNAMDDWSVEPNFHASASNLCMDAHPTTISNLSALQNKASENKATDSVANTSSIL